MMEHLFLKDDLDLSPLEVHLKEHPSAADWSVSMFVCQPDIVDVEWAKSILQFQSLYPKGLNEELQFHSKEDWINFIEWAQNK